ncbi:uncharacterized protein DNG_10254 [Cephalotrichum gorgonifer]|uniref:Enoyl reductase (ER) domain-containing protein n=1 Tax=Cephalotrichum gorgonifer TaxID=2041049 RepID=A0AAE8T010_9PEZI|nr:uncharacterized protein DNG_10254 [Cephalotrichum gorgonifer]
MLALRAQNASSGLKLETIAIPDVGPQDVLIRVAAAGITPGVVKLLRMGQAHVPTTVGHEAAGTVAALGNEVPVLSVGTRVRMHATLSCRKCHECTNGRDQMCPEAALIGFAKFGETSPLYRQYHDGGLAEYVRVPYWAVDPLPDHVSFEVGAKIHDIATALRVLKLADIQKDATIVVTSATGTMGTLTLRLAKMFSIKKIILVGRSEERLEKVRRLTSIETVVCPLPPLEEARSPTGPHLLAQKLRSLASEGIRAIIDYLPTGNHHAQILPALCTGGTFVHIGGNVMPLAIPMVVIMQRCWRIVGSRSHEREDTDQVLKWLAERRIEVEDLITHRFSLPEVDRAIEILESRSQPVWMSVIEVVK